MAKHIKYILLISFISGVFNSCSKDDSSPAPASPKLLKEVKTVYNNIVTGLLDSTIIAYDYNSNSQITKMTFKHEPGYYVVFEYSGDIPISRKEYYYNNLVLIRNNFVSVSRDTITITFINDPAPNSYDSVVHRYSFEGKNMTQAQTLLFSKTGNDNEYIDNFTYTSDYLASTWYLSFQNGVSGSVGKVTSVKQSDDKFNPYSGLSPMNQAIIGMGSEVTIHGLHNVLQFETATSVGGLFEYTYDKDGFALTMKEPRINGSFKTFTYNR